MQSIAMDAIGSSPRLREHTTEPRLCRVPVPVSGLLLREARMLVQTSFFLLTGRLSPGLSLQQVFGPTGSRQPEPRGLPPSRRPTPRTRTQSSPASHRLPPAL